MSEVLGSRPDNPEPASAGVRGVWRQWHCWRWRCPLQQLFKAGKDVQLGVHWLGLIRDLGGETTRKVMTGPVNSVDPQDLSTQRSAGRDQNKLDLVQVQRAQGVPLSWLAVARLLQSASPDREPLGHGVRPERDALQVHHSHVFGFSSQEVSALTGRDSRKDGTFIPMRLTQDAVGLLGSNGPLPYAWTEYLQELGQPSGPDDRSAEKSAAHVRPMPRLNSRQARERVESFKAFINLLQRRHLALLVRAWLETRAETAFDPFTKHYAHPLTRRLSALAGVHETAHGDASDTLVDRRDLGAESLQVPDDFKRAYASVLARRVKSPVPLAAMLSRYLDMPVCIDEFVPRWMQLAQSERSRLGRAFCTLGCDAMLGERSWDARQHFRIVVGPIGLDKYMDFLPSGALHQQVSELVAATLGAHWSWELTPLLEAAAAPSVNWKPGASPTRLGQACWLGHRGTHEPAADLTISMRAPLHLALAVGTAQLPHELEAAGLV